MAAHRAKTRHDEQAIVVRGADLGVAIHGDERVAPGNDVAAAERLQEGETAGRGGHGKSDFRDFRYDLGIAYGVRACVVHHAEQPQEAADAAFRRRDGLLSPVPAALGQAGGGGLPRVGERPVVYEPRTGSVAAVADDEGGGADAGGEAAALLRRAGEDQGIGRPQHAVQVEQCVRALNEGPHLAGAVQLAGAARAVEHGLVPDAVEVLVEEAGGGRLRRVEASEGGEVGEADGELAACRAEGAAQHAVERYSTGDLVTVDQRDDERVRAWAPGIELREARHPDVARAPGREVGRLQRDLEGRHAAACRAGISALAKLGAEGRGAGAMRSNLTRSACTATARPAEAPAMAAALTPLHRLWRLLPPRGRRRALLRAATLLAPRPDQVPPPVREGVIVVGELGRASGLGEGARLVLAGLAALGVPAWTDAREAPPGAALLLYVNAPQVPLALSRLGRRAVRGRRVIGFWNWELPVADPDWRIAAPLVHEVWVPSQFTAAALEPLVPGRVRVVSYPLALRPPVPSLLSRAAFGLPERAVVTLAVMSLASSFVRKNPLAVIAAHWAAFGTRADRILVLKVTDPYHFPEDFARLHHACMGITNIQIAAQTLPRADLHALMAASDIVLSLHRSEGFGLVPAEAMLLGRAVVATDWSATAEFLDDRVAAPVPVRMVPVGDPRGVYAVPGAEWAEPDVAAAAAWLQLLAENPVLRAAMGAKARAAAQLRFGPEALAAAVQGLGLPIPGVAKDAAA